MPTSRKPLWLTLGVSLAILILIFFTGFYFYKHDFVVDNVETTSGMFEVINWQDESGVKVVFTPLPELPFMDIHILYKAGSAYEGEKFGLAQLTQQMIGEKTQNKSSETIHDTFESVGAVFGAHAGRDSFGISLRTLTERKYRNTALDMLNEILGETAFDETIFKREQQRLLTAIISQKQNPGAVIRDAFYEKLYPNHPYAHPVMGTEKTVSALTVEDAKQYFQQQLIKENAVIAIAGDLSTRQAQSIASDLIAAMTSGQAAGSLPPIPQATTSTEDIAFPSSQTHIIFGLPAIQKGNPDYFALSVGNQVLGGMPLVNQLFMEVREKNGLAYNVGSSITTLKEPGPFSIYLQTRTDEAKKAQKLALDTLKQYVLNGPTESELQAAKDNLNGQFLLGLSSNASIAAHIAMLAFYDLPWDYQDKFMSNINAVTQADVKAAFNRYIQPDNMTFITLGQ